MTDLDFITDTKLRKTVEDSIEHTYVLLKETKEDSKSARYKEETYRVIVLYTVAVIETVLLYLYKRSGEGMTSIDYKFIKTLPSEYCHSSEIGSKVVVAVQKITNKPEHKIGMQDLVSFFKDKKVMKKETVDKLISINDIRNTFHLSKSRDGMVCDIEQVEVALKMLVYVILDVHKTVSIKK